MKFNIAAVDAYNGRFKEFFVEAPSANEAVVSLIMSDDPDYLEDITDYLEDITDYLEDIIRLREQVLECKTKCNAGWAFRMEEVIYLVKKVKQ